jgi:hypothetical protein
MGKVEKERWQDRLAASELMRARCRALEPCDGRLGQ